ncbi:MAG: tyrosine-type recombinase/integrase [Ktedonobacteraceae bacterium]|nr:tyrosine-type recombinase/integrase [Ktedonobacteraceae bacterium]
MLLRDAARHYPTFCQVEKQNAPQTIQKYNDCLNAWILPHLGSKQLEELDRLMLMGFRKLMVEKSLSTYRQYSVLMVLKSVLKFAREVLKVECINPREIKLPNRGTPEVSVLTPDELNQLFAHLDVHTYTGSRLRAIIEIILASGMRISEVLSLSRSVFDAELDETQIVGKGSKTRTVFLNARSRLWVNNYLNKRFDDNLALFVTTGPNPGRLSREDISRFFINLRKRAELPKKVTPHVLRHTYCTTLLNNGADITFIKELAGHSNIQTTARYYLGVDRQQLRKVVDKYLKYDIEAPSESGPSAK